MKALTFIDYYKTLWQIDNFDFQDAFNRAEFYRIFINQDFKPEMITELFEGFEKKLDWDKSIFFERNNYQIRIFQKYLNIEQRISFLVNDRTIISLAPKTLNDFINDCQRVGIELEWSEKALHQYEVLNN